MGLRSDLRDHLEAELGDGVNVYAAGVDVLAVPAVVLNPSDPYLAPATMRDEPMIGTALDIHLITHRVEPSIALDSLEDLRKQVTDALKTFSPASRWTAFGQWGSTEIGGTAYAMAVLDVLFRDNDRGSSL